MGRSWVGNLWIRSLSSTGPAANAPMIGASPTSAAR